MHADLFPETLLVDITDGHTFTTSLKIAEHFHKEHADVLRAIRNIIAQCTTPEQLRNFAELYITYTVKNGAKRKRPIFHLTRDGYEFVVGRFTGEIAFEWQWKFIDAFNFMETELRAHVAREAEALYVLRPHWRTIGQASGMKRAAICQLTGHRNVDTISANRRRMREAGILTASH